METLPVLSITLFPGGGYRVTGEETAAYSETGALRIVRVSSKGSADLEGFTVLNGTSLFAWIHSGTQRDRAMLALRDYYEAIGVTVIEQSVDDNGRGDSALLGGLGGAVVGGAVAGPVGALVGGVAGLSLGSAVHHHSRADAAFISS